MNDYAEYSEKNHFLQYFLTTGSASLIFFNNSTAWDSFLIGFKRAGFAIISGNEAINWLKNKHLESVNANINVRAKNFGKPLNCSIV